MRLIALFLLFALPLTARPHHDFSGAWRHPYLRINAPTCQSFERTEKNAKQAHTIITVYRTPFCKFDVLGMMQAGFLVDQQIVDDTPPILE